MPETERRKSLHRRRSQYLYELFGCGDQCVVVSFRQPGSTSRMEELLLDGR